MIDLTCCCVTAGVHVHVTGCRCRRTPPLATRSRHHRRRWLCDGLRWHRCLRLRLVDGARFLSGGGRLWLLHNGGLLCPHALRRLLRRHALRHRHLLGRRWLFRYNRVRGGNRLNGDCHRRVLGGLVRGGSFCPSAVGISPAGVSVTAGGSTDCVVSAGLPASPCATGSVAPASSRLVIGGSGTGFGRCVVPVVMPNSAPCCPSPPVVIPRGGTTAPTRSAWSRASSRRWVSRYCSWKISLAAAISAVALLVASRANSASVVYTPKVIKDYPRLSQPSIPSPLTDESSLALTRDCMTQHAPVNLLSCAGPVFPKVEGWTRPGSAAWIVQWCQPALILQSPPNLRLVPERRAGGFATPGLCSLPSPTLPGPSE